MDSFAGFGKQISGSRIEKAKEQLALMSFVIKKFRT